MGKKAGIGLAVIGVLYIINAIFGRYIVLPGCFESLGKAASAAALPADVPLLKVLRCLFWAFSFKFGMYFIILGFLLTGTWKASERSAISSSSWPRTTSAPSAGSSASRCSPIR
jgi:hypothetical protein